MDNKARAFVYAFLSRCYEKEPDIEFVKELKSNIELLSAVGEDSVAWFQKEKEETLLEALNIDFASAFLVNSQPVETLVLDSKGEILTGLQNPVMQFYFDHGYEIDMNKTEILAPDHLSIELAFMQNLSYRNESRAALKFLREHLLKWVPPYLIGIKNLLQTPFYGELADMTIEFLLTECENLKRLRD